MIFYYNCQWVMLLPLLCFLLSFFLLLKKMCGNEFVGLLDGSFRLWLVKLTKALTETYSQNNNNIYFTITIPGWRHCGALHFCQKSNHRLESWYLCIYKVIIPNAAIYEMDQSKFMWYLQLYISWSTNLRKIIFYKLKIRPVWQKRKFNISK